MELIQQGVNSKNQIYGFDILKMFMALCIVAIHARPFENAPELSAYFAPFLNSAVPIFFILSSFFLFRKLNTNGYHWGILGNWLKRVCCLYLFWLVVNLPFVIHDRLQWVSEPVGTIVWFAIRDLLFSHTFGGSWFLSALVFGVLLAFLTGKLFKNKQMLYPLLVIIASILFLFFNFRENLPLWVNDVYGWISTNIRDEVALTPLMGVLWCNVGCVLASDNCIKLLKRLKDLKCGIFIILLGLIACYILYLNISNEDTHCILSLGIVLLFFTLGYCIKLPESTIYKSMRNYSILFYFLHFIWLKIYAHTLAPVANGGGYKYLIIIVLCAISATLIIKLSEKKYFKWLKYSY